MKFTKWTLEQDQMIINTTGPGANRILGEMWNIDFNAIRHRRAWLQNGSGRNYKPRKEKTEKITVGLPLSRPEWFEEDIEKMIRGRK